MDNGAFVTSELIKRLSHKTLKIRIGCISLLINAIRSFGIGVIPVKELLKSLTTIFEDSDKKMRELAIELTVELYRWIRDAVKSQLDGLRLSQMSELESKFKEIESSGEPVAPTRALRSQQGKSKSLDDTLRPSSAPNSTSQFDADDLFDSFDVLAGLKNTWFTAIVCFF